ncbi:SMI1/KNR4 family protein [Endozoicomonas sp. SM1973]|uniref:SMI1/KNR4 family protein n=1 Tax=Spartinivicinus marinus TaxID=2994442 RepID=A0A853IA89_9GAMM|nr:SMI1/KNR4 family protein [Spartinivicinus marinus]MCX4026436.1 SMI1/KNR4 family protein [Spartinivicinus marinus]NYZ69839.1 SMI1/KNR4 family protein [Spartinivicinus marinus]
MTQQITLNEIYRQLQQKPEYMDLGREATEEEIKHIENTLQVKLPEYYADFLRRFGFMLGDGICINGVCPSELNDYVSVIDFTKDRREGKYYAEGLPKLEHNAVVVLDNGESYVSLFCEGHPRAGQVVWRHLAEDYRETETFENFPQFLTFWLD